MRLEEDVDELKVMQKILFVWNATLTIAVFLLLWGR